jgi:hypothetical protein
MKKLFVFVLGAVLSVVALTAAAESSLVIQGYTTGQGGAGLPSVQCTADASGVTVTLPVVLIRTQREGVKGPFTAATLYTDKASGRSSAYRLFPQDGATVYALALGPYGWMYDGKIVDVIDPANTENGYIAAAPVVNGSVTLHFKPFEGFLGFNGVAILQDGTHAWLGVETVNYTVHNVDKNPLIVVGSNCEL